MRALLIAALAAALCGYAAAATEVQATIDNFSFTPASITINAGTTVVWTNRDDIPHTIADAAAPGTIRSPPLDTGDHYARLFTTPGTYKYFCSLHPRMQGTIVVR